MAVSNISRIRVKYLARLHPEARAAAGISEGLLRVAVGLEAVEDLQADLERGLSLI